MGEPFIIPMRTWETTAHLQTGQCCSDSIRLLLAWRSSSFNFLNLMVLTQRGHFLSTICQKLPFCKLKVHNFGSHRSYFPGVGRNQPFDVVLKTVQNALHLFLKKG